MRKFEEQILKDIREEELESYHVKGFTNLSNEDYEELSSYLQMIDDGIFAIPSGKYEGNSTWGRYYTHLSIIVEAEWEKANEEAVEYQTSNSDDLEQWEFKWSLDKASAKFYREEA